MDRPSRSQWLARPSGTLTHRRLGGILPGTSAFLLLTLLLAPPTVAQAQSPGVTMPAGTPAPSGSASAAALCAQGTTACVVSAGTYETLPFQPDFTLTVGDGWSNDLGYPDAGQVSKEAGAVVWASGVRADEHVGTPAIADAATLLASLAALPGATVSAPVPTTVGGSPAQAVEVAMGSEGGDGVFICRRQAGRTGSERDPEDPQLCPQAVGSAPRYPAANES
jgi:hypothetical protein